MEPYGGINHLACSPPDELQEEKGGGVHTFFLDPAQQDVSGCWMQFDSQAPPLEPNPNNDENDSHRIESALLEQDETLPSFAVPVTTDRVQCGQNLSTEEVVRLAAEKYIKFSTQKVNGYTMFIHPYGSSALSSLSMEETREVDLACQLLTAAEKVARRQYDVARKFLKRCEWVASDQGTPIERLVFYFAEALRKRIDSETRSPDEMEEPDQVQGIHPLHGLGTNPTFLAAHKGLPFSQVLTFTGIQAIIDHIAIADKVHVIDLHVRSGVQWPPLMQALAVRKNPLQLLKITALQTPCSDKIEETGERLQSFAKSLNLHFSFNIVPLSDMKDLEAEDFCIQDDETVAVYAQIILRSMLCRTDRLEKLMEVMGKIKPVVIVVAEVEANLNSTSFVSRFTEALFFYSAFFDCLEDNMERDNKHRLILEGFHLSEGIKDIVSNEGEERSCRSVTMDTWRSFFTRLGMVEVGLSEASWYQANLVLQQFSSGNSCTLESNGKCLIVGWKGTPLHSLSTWSFS